MPLMQNFQRKEQNLIAMGKTFDIQFFLLYFKHCEKHAKYFKAEATVYRSKSSFTS